MYYFIINPHSQSGHGLEVWQKADAILQEKGVEYTTYFTEYTGLQPILQNKAPLEELPAPCP